MNNYKYFTIVTGLGIQPQAVGIRNPCVEIPSVVKLVGLHMEGFLLMFTEAKQ